MKKHTIFYLLISLVPFMLGGCGSTKGVNPKDEYTIVLELPKRVTSSKASGCKESSLKILEPFGAYEYTIDGLFYVVLPNKQDRYTLSSWTESVSSMVYREILQALKQSRLFKSVSNYSSIAKSSYILEMEINNFKQYCTKDLKKSYVAIDLTFTLIDAKNFKVIAQKEFIKQRQSRSNDAKGGVEALNSAFGELVPEVIAWLEGVCR